MDEGTLEVYDRKNALAHPDLAARRALYSRAVETSDKTPFEQALEAGQTDEMSKHDSTAPHHQAMRDQNVEYWEQTHEPTGRRGAEPPRGDLDYARPLWAFSTGLAPSDWLS